MVIPGLPKYFFSIHYPVNRLFTSVSAPVLAEAGKYLSVLSGIISPAGSGDLDRLLRRRERKGFCPVAGSRSAQTKDNARRMGES